MTVPIVLVVVVIVVLAAVGLTLLETFIITIDYVVDRRGG